MWALLLIVGNLDLKFFSKKENKAAVGISSLLVFSITTLLSRNHCFCHKIAITV